jgi:CRISPR-associated exonuclease Cas4
LYRLTKLNFYYTLFKGTTAYYARSHQRQLVEISEVLREETIATINAIQILLQTGKMPPASYSKRCQGCSLYQQCLPQAAEKVLRYQEAN